MSKFSKQFAIIEKLKSLVKRSTYSFRRKDDAGQISEDIAKKIQKNSYEQSHTKYKDTYTPPYKMIAEQLQVDDDQIFRGAIFNLTNIALTTDKYAPEIITVLETAMDRSIRTPNQIEYIKSKINTIRKAHKVNRN